MNDILVQSLGEFLGTFILVLLGDGVVAGVSLKKSKAQNAGWVAITLGWGLAVTIAVYASGFMGPAHLNPAVTIGLAAGGLFPWNGVLPFIVAQMLGAFLGAVVVWAQYYDLYNATDDPATILGTFATGPAIRNYFSNFLSEVIGTFVLVFVIMAFSRGKFTAGLNPIAVGLLIVSIGLSLGGTTGYAINPARDLGPRIAHALLPMKNKGGSDWSYSWVPILGPIVGALLAALLFVILP